MRETTDREEQNYLAASEAQEVYMPPSTKRLRRLEYRGPSESLSSDFACPLSRPHQLSDIQTACFQRHRQTCGMAAEFWENEQPLSANDAGVPCMSLRT